MLTAEIIAIGSELLTPRFQDTNSVYLTEQLNRIGISVAMRTVAGDHEANLEHAIKAAIARTPIVITIGGLGPTEDDITRKVAAQATHRQLVLDDGVLEKLQSRFAKRGMPMPANNARQALVPSGAEILDNPNGTAPGLWLVEGRSTLILLPGPFRELEPMFERSCYPRLAKMAGSLAMARRVYRTTGLPESVLDARISPIYTKYKNPETTVLSEPGRVDVHLIARARSHEEAETLLDEVGNQIDQQLGEFVFARTEQELEEVVGMYLVMRKATIAVAESCTGGLIAQRLTSVPGSSKYFSSGIVTYSNESKVELAGIPPLLLEMEGAVSKAVSLGLAEGVREKVGSTIGVGLTGIAGPSGGTPEKPVGTVHAAVAGPVGSKHLQFVFLGSRDRVRWQSSQAALDMVRRYLESL
jgi:nicotinamide-nucleotide amidase